MKWGWILLLGLSLGLNVGLSLKLFTGGDAGIGSRPPAFLHRPPGMDGGGGPPPDAEDFARHHLRRMADRLGIDDAQRGAMSAVIHDMMPRILEQREAVGRHRLAIHDEYEKNDPDPAVIRESVRELNRAQAVLDSLVAETMLHEADVLTPDQRREYFRAMPWSDDRGPRGRRGPGRGR